MRAKRYSTHAYVHKKSKKKKRKGGRGSRWLPSIFKGPVRQMVVDVVRKNEACCRVSRRYEKKKTRIMQDASGKKRLCTLICIYQRHEPVYLNRHFCKQKKKTRFTSHSESYPSTSTPPLGKISHTIRGYDRYTALSYQSGKTKNSIFEKKKNHTW